MDWHVFFTKLVDAAVFGALGIVLFLVAMKIVVKVSPFSIRKEIEEDQNVALAVLVGSVFIAIGLVVAAAVQG